MALFKAKKLSSWQTKTSSKCTTFCYSCDLEFKKKIKIREIFILIFISFPYIILWFFFFFYWTLITILFPHWAILAYSERVCQPEELVNWFSIDKYGASLFEKILSFFKMSWERFHLWILFLLFASSLRANCI